jgi:hypothetical protein
MSVKSIYIDPLFLASDDVGVRKTEIKRRVAEGLQISQNESVIVLPTNHPD